VPSLDIWRRTGGQSHECRIAQAIAVVACCNHAIAGIASAAAAAIRRRRVSAQPRLSASACSRQNARTFSHLLLDKIKGELYYAFAETDHAVPAHIPGELKKALDKADVNYELKVFPGTQHGFCFPERAVYDTLAAEETWSKIFAMWDRCLK